MRTLVFSRRQQGPAQVTTTGSEIEEIVPPLHEEICVAVGEDMSESVNALKWALLNLKNRQTATVILLHIQLPLRYMPSPMGRIPKNRVSEDVLKAYEEDVEKKLNNCMNKYLDICSRAKVKAEPLVVEKADVFKGIVEVVSEKGIMKLIIGTTSAMGAISKKMKMQPPGIADYVRRYAIESCEVSIVCKGKLVLLREGSPVHHVAAQKSKSHRSPTTKFKPDDLSRSISSPPHIQRDSGASLRSPSNFPVATECMPAPAEEVNESAFEVSDAIHQHSSESEAGDSPQIDLTPNNIEVTPQASQEASTDIESLKLQLSEALQVAEIETVGRKKAEADSMKAINKLKNLEAVLKEIDKEKEDATSLLRLTEQKCQEITRRRDEVEEELQAMEEKLTSLATNLNQVSRDRHESIHELKQARQKLAAMEEQNYRVLQQKDAKIKQLQECLQSMPRVETLTTPASSSANTLEFRKYSLDDIKSATCNFTEHFKLGKGGYGTVYKGEIRQTTVAVKLLGEDSLQGRQQFQREIDILRDIRHQHLVMVVGSCFERGCIVYEYMSNGCLADRLCCKNATPPLPWHARFRIAAEIGSALQYLHSCKPDPIVHHDLKPENILLDDDYVSKISDFGLARLVRPDSRPESEPRGTFSYMDPEYLTSGEYTTKSDIYSLGIVILELLTGKPALGLVKEVERALENAKLDQVLDPSAGEWPFVQTTQLAYLALHCTEPVRKNRPDLQPTVMKMLDQLRNFAVSASNSSRPVKRGQKSVHAAEEIHVPSFFLCPIFKEVMQNPYVAADGFTYEREAIQRWFDCGRDTSPMTNNRLGQKNLVANYSLRSAIRQWQGRGDLL